MQQTYRNILLIKLLFILPGIRIFFLFYRVKVLKSTQLHTPLYWVALMVKRTFHTTQILPFEYTNIYQITSYFIQIARCIACIILDITLTTLSVSKWNYRYLQIKSKWHYVHPCVNVECTGKVQINTFCHNCVQLYILLNNNARDPPRPFLLISYNFKKNVTVVLHLSFIFSIIGNASL
jgi:hypothetical protein